MTRDAQGLELPTPSPRHLVRDRLRVRVRALRLERGLSVNKIAEALGLSAQAYRARERVAGDTGREFHMSELHVLAKLFGLSIDDLMNLGPEFQISVRQEQDHISLERSENEDWAEALAFAEQVAQIKDADKRGAVSNMVRQVAASSDYSSSVDP